MATNDAQALDKENGRHVLRLPDAGRAQRNPISSVLRLPYELLATILIHCARDYHYHEDRHCRLGCVPRWVNASYVCRRWRDVALNCPTLWTYHFVLSLRWSDELLARSKHAPFKVRIRHASGFESWWMGLLERLMNHAERIQELDLVLPWKSGAIPEMFFRLSIRARHLRSLTIVLPERGESDSPSLLLHGDLAPSLRELGLSHCPVPWRSFMPSALTSFRLCNVPRQFRKDMVEFLATLGSMQSLTQLYLDRAISDTPSLPTSTTISSNAYPNINLPRLSRLSIAAPSQTIIVLLSCISMPLETELRLTYHDSPTENVISLSSILAHRFETSNDPTSSLPTIRSLAVRYLCPFKLGFVFSSLGRNDNSSRVVSKAWNDDEWGCHIPLKILVAEFYPSSKDRMISDIYRPLPLENVQSVHTIDLYISQDLWMETFGRFPRLRHIRLHNGNMCGITSVLSNPPHDCTENARFALALEELELHGVELRRVQPPNEPLDSFYTFGLDLPSLLDALSSRTTRCNLIMTECRQYGNSKSKPWDVVGRWEGEEFKIHSDYPGLHNLTRKSTFGGR